MLFSIFFLSSIHPDQERPETWRMFESGSREIHVSTPLIHL